MPSTLPNTTTTDKYVQVLGGSAIYDRGQFLIANNPVSLIVQRGPDKSTYTEDEYPYLTPTSFPFQRSAKEYIVGVKVKSAIVGSPAQVSGFLLEPDVAGVGLGSAFLANVATGGGVTPGNASVQIDKDGALVGSEPALDFRTGIGAQPGMLMSIADDVVNTKVTAQILGFPMVDVVAGNALPAGVDGLTIAYYPDKTNFPDALWIMRYNGATARWEWAGGSELVQYDSSGTNRQNTVDNTWEDCPGINRVTVARAGTYLAEYGCHNMETTGLGNDMSINVSPNGAVPGGGSSLRRAPGVALTNPDYVPGGFMKRPFTIGAGQYLALQLISVPHLSVAYVGPMLGVRPLYFT